MNNEEINEIKQNNLLKSLKGIGIFLALFGGFLIIPQIIGSVFYFTFKLNEIVSIAIGNTTYAVILIIIYKDMLLGKLKDYAKNFAKYFRSGLKCWFVGFLAMIVFNLLLSYLVFGGEIAANEEANRELINGNILVGFYSVVLIAPFVEEMIFRFGMRKITNNKIIFPIITGLIFGLVHIIFTDIKTPLDFLYILPYGSLGVAFGISYMKSDNIYSSITLHMLHNFISIMAVITSV